MDKKGEGGDILYDVIIYLILLVIFFVGMLYYVLQQQGGAAIWEEYYAKEIVKMIDFSRAEDEFFFDVQRASEIAKKNGVLNFNKMFSFDNAAHEVCVKLNVGRKTCYSYFNDVDIINADLKFAEGKNEEREDVNVLYFKIVEKQKKNVGESKDEK